MRGRGPMLGCKLKPESIHNNTRLIWFVTWPLQWCPNFVGQAFPVTLRTPCISLNISYYGHVLNFRLRKSHGFLCDLRHQACERGGNHHTCDQLSHSLSDQFCQLGMLHRPRLLSDVGLIISGFKRENILHWLVPW